jgi:hypothetical protein
MARSDDLTSRVIDNAAKWLAEEKHKQIDDALEKYMLPLPCDCCNRDDFQIVENIHDMLTILLHKGVCFFRIKLNMDGERAGITSWREP